METTPIIYCTINFYATENTKSLYNHIWIDIRDSPIFSVADKKILFIYILR